MATPKSRDLIESPRRNSLNHNPSPPIGRPAHAKVRFFAFLPSSWSRVRRAPGLGWGLLLDSNQRVCSISFRRLRALVQYQFCVFLARGLREIMFCFSN